MPYSFTQIEEDKTRTIALVFSFLIGFYFLAFFLIATIVVNINEYNNLAYERMGSYTPHFLSAPDTLMVLGVAFIVGYVHWYFTTHNLVNKILGVLGAEKLKDNDSYHQMFKNIVEEVSVATGGAKIEGVVVPTMAMNAFALSDFQGRNVIGITEGILARLNRAQVEAIVGHEAAHIVSKDCLATTVTSSLFELYGGLLKGCELFLRAGGRRSYRSSRSSRDSGGGVIAVILLVYLLLLITKFLSHLVRMFISRQREYRADAIAVRLTRDPLSLAEALYAIGYHWRGQGLAAQELEAIFIVNPQYAHLDETEGFFASLFSTHPPIESRLKVLMEMARTDADTLIGNVEKLDKKPRSGVPDAPGTADTWMVKHGDGWQGPFELVQMATFDWLTPQTWVRRADNDEIKMAYQDTRLTSMITAGKEGAGRPGGCPRCHLPLAHVNYEGASVEKCPFCKGVLVEESDVKRLIIRQEVGFSERVKKIAEGLKQERDLFATKIDRDPKSLVSCPHCSHPQAKMMRSFYTEVYRVEIDRCFSCGRVWFDADELEVLQCMIEDATAQTQT